MFKVNKLTDYATVILIEMAATNSVRSAQSISMSTGIPLPTIVKLMKVLVKAGLAAAQRGALGGYRLTRSEDRISIADIIEALEGPIALTACVSASEKQCSFESLCPAVGKWDGINHVVTDALRKVPLSDMIHNSAEVHNNLDVQAKS